MRPAAEPSLAVVRFLWSENGSVPVRSFASLAAADAALAEAFDVGPPSDLDSYMTAFELVWTDGQKHEGRVELRRVDVQAALATGGVLRQHLAYVGRWLRDKAATSILTKEHWTPEQVAEKTAWGAELLRRIAAEPALAAHRNVAVPPVARVEILWSENGAVPVRSFRSLAAADAALAAAFQREPPPKGGAYNKTAFMVVWTDGKRHEGRADVRQVDVETAPSAGGILRKHLRHVGTWLRDNGPVWLSTDPEKQTKERAESMAWGEELLRRLDAEPPLAPHRNAAVPPVARVEILWSTIDTLGADDHPSMDQAEAAISAAVRSPRSDAGTDRDQVLFRVVWADGRSHDDGVTFPRGDVPPTVLRARLRAVAVRQRDVYGKSRHLTEEERAERRAWGDDMLARLDADAPRNAQPGWSPPTLLPDPADAVRRLRRRFVGRRRTVAAIGTNDDGEGSTFPATNHADIRYVCNYVSVALGNDLRVVDPAAAGVIWNHWRAVRDTIDTLLRVGDSTDEYADNEGFWTRQLPALVRLIDDAHRELEPVRNGRLTFRPVGNYGESYPPWVADLRGRSGVYIIRSPGEDGSLETVYVGSSSADRLHETLTRHLQSWRRAKKFWRGGFTEGHDPGLTYPRDTAEAAVIITPAEEALELESELIRRLRPRDNLIGQADEAEPIPF